MTIKPLHDHVIIKPVINDMATRAGIILPDTVNKEKAEKGEVMAVGPGRLTDAGARLPISVQIGQVVMFKKYSPDEIKIEGEDYLVISDRDIIAIL